MRGDYAMHVGKAVSKKKQAGDRPDLEYRHTSGGHVFVFNAGIFEYVKNHLLNRFEQLHCPKHLVTDNRDCVHTISINVDSDDTTQFTVNLYLTTSKIVANGEGSDNFLELLRKTLERVDREFADYVNKIIKNVDSDNTRRSERTRKQTQKALLSQQQKNKTKQIKPRNISEISRFKLQSAHLPAEETGYAIMPILESDLDSRTDTAESMNIESEDCPVCAGMVEGNANALACDFCEAWTHMECDDSMTPELFSEHTVDSKPPISARYVPWPSRIMTHHRKKSENLPTDQPLMLQMK